LALEEETADDMQLEESTPLWEEALGQPLGQEARAAAPEALAPGDAAPDSSPASDAIGTPSVWS